MRYFSLRAAATLALASLTLPAFATEAYFIGTTTTWTSNWTAVSGLADAADGGTARLDFVGDATTPVLYWASDAEAVYFRMRVADPAAATAAWSDAIFLMIDRVGYGTGGPDFAFAWDSKSADTAGNGLEMAIINTQGSGWTNTRFGDMDGVSSSKTAVDINGGGRSGDGFVRVVDGQAGGAFGTTSFVDFKVTWNYLTNYSTTGLAADQQWQVTVGSINNANDHNFIGNDVIGAVTDSPTNASSWGVSVGAIPEPAHVGVMGAAALALTSLAVRRRRR